MVAASVPVNGHRSGSTASSPSSKTRCSSSTSKGARAAARSRSRLAATTEAVRAVPLERPRDRLPALRASRHPAPGRQASGDRRGRRGGRPRRLRGLLAPDGRRPLLRLAEARSSASATDQNQLRQLPHQTKQPAPAPRTTSPASRLKASSSRLAGPRPRSGLDRLIPASDRGIHG